MIDSVSFYKLLIHYGINFFTGVPDSVLKEFCNYLCEHISPKKHIIAANEGGAIALAAGYYLASGKIPLVYMQNAGLGNAVNPLTSLVNKEVYGIPMILLIGWRGEPFGGQAGKPDEPQHIKEGEATLPLLNVLNIPHVVLSDSLPQAKKQIVAAIKTAKKQSAPYALVVQRA